MNKSALYQTVSVSSGFFVYSLGFIQMDILTPIECFYFGTIFILLAVLRNRLDNSSKSKNRITKDVFSSLNIPALKETLKYWGDSWDNVKKITLYPAPPNLPVIGGETIKYILHWKCSKIHPMLEHVLLEGKWGCNKMLIDDDQYKKIYKEIPRGEYRNEWHCVTKMPQNIDKRYSVLLYPIK